MRVAVIGAGPAGLAFAFEFLSRADRSADLFILEKDAICGGISRTVSFGSNRMDIGGHRFLTKNRRILDFWNMIMPFGQEMKWRERQSSIFYEDSLYQYPLKPGLNMARKFGAKKIVSVLFSLMLAKISRLPETNLENFYINRFGRTLYDMFFRTYTEKVWGRSPSSLSARWGAQRVKGLSLIKAIMDGLGFKSGELSLTDRFLYPDFGPGQFFNRLLDRCVALGASYMPECRVKKILPGVRKTIIYETVNGQADLKVDVIVSAMPLKELSEAINAPEPARTAMKNLAYRDFLTVGLVIPEQSAAAALTDNWIYVQRPDIKMGRIQFFRNWSPLMCEDNCVGLEYFCDRENPSDIWHLTDEQLVRMAATELEALGLVPRMDRVMGHVERMPMAYPVYPESLSGLEKARQWLVSLDGIYCIGRNGQHRYNNMDHSMLTGLMTADLLLGSSISKDDIWNVNSENEYIESDRESLNSRKLLRL